MKRRVKVKACCGPHFNWEQVKLLIQSLCPPFVPRSTWVKSLYVHLYYNSVSWEITVTRPGLISQCVYTGVSVGTYIFLVSHQVWTNFWWPEVLYPWIVVDEVSEGITPNAAPLLDITVMGKKQKQKTLRSSFTEGDCIFVWRTKSLPSEYVS